MDALPAPLSPEIDTDIFVTDETYAAYCTEAASYLADRTRDAERERDKSRWLGWGGLAVGLAGVAIAGFVSLRSRPEGWILSFDSNTGRVGIVQRLDQTQLPPPVENWLTARYVEMRESYNDASDGANFDAVACMSDLPEQKSFEAWHDSDPTAPQQIFAKARNHGFRTAVATSDPIPVGTGKDGATRVQVRFEYRDKISADTPAKPVSGTATFTTRKDRKHISPCDPAGLVVSDYERSIDRESQP